MAKSETAELSLATTPQTLDVQAFDLTNNNLPDLESAHEMPLDFMSDYWTPENIGESKRVFFVKIDKSLVRDINDAEVVHELPCAFFLERTPKGEVRQIRNGSKRLVGALEVAYEQAMIQRGTPLLITYLGKKSNKTNSFKSDNWSIKPLVINV
ncbi:hypothetical protein DYU11_22735 [Fibrisoma montanum]|uniref:Uncharacterized protein n=1 Tax=Fibrisoma montanum TaxID=2305895 RepID=A0A418M2H2_9BACT|nr:hypothetical protein [Fibrisoma montanum]RIV19749.1 hypothetical protein DYU11_22735 [Fibrisoma montanum]